ncbi:DUF4340 domain-containing protein [bacterium]|nr:DUF4340 domain-containing protein [bacterium]
MNKKNILALIILVIIVGVYLIVNQDDASQEEFYYFQNTSDAYHTISISQGNDKITLVKNNNVWEMTEPVESPIKKRKIDDLITKLTSSKTSSLPVSVSEKSQDIYNLTDSLATLITIHDSQGNELTKALIGKTDSPQFSYARHPQSTEIYQLSENLSWTVNPDVNGWRENIVLELNSDNIIDFQVATQEREYKFTYADTLWKFTENDFTQDVTDDNKIMKSLLNRFKSLRSTNFLDNEFESYEELLDTPYLSIKINTSDVGTKILTVIPYDATSDLLQLGSQKSPLYLIPKNIREDFDFELDALVQ